MVEAKGSCFAIKTESPKETRGGGPHLWPGQFFHLSSLASLPIIAYTLISVHANHHVSLQLFPLRTSHRHAHDFGWIFWLLLGHNSHFYLHCSANLHLFTSACMWLCTHLQNEIIFSIVGVSTCFIMWISWSDLISPKVIKIWSFSKPGHSRTKYVLGPQKQALFGLGWMDG